MSTGLRILVLTAALGCGTLGGTLFAFSGFVMPALARLPGPAGVAAMQSINVTALRFPLGSVLAGTTLACIAVLVAGFLRLGEPGTIWMLAGAALFLVGGLLVTGLLNVPMNEQLAVMDPVAAASDGSWSEFLRGWTAANHLRTVASLAASACLMTAAAVGG